MRAIVQCRLLFTRMAPEGITSVVPDLAKRYANPVLFTYV
jgi:hypothetical protein